MGDVVKFGRRCANVLEVVRIFLRPYGRTG